MVPVSLKGWNNKWANSIQCEIGWKLKRIQKSDCFLVIGEVG